MVIAGKSLSTAMNARIIGSGDEAIILAHGYGGNQSVWDKVLPYLAQHCRVLVFDWAFSGAVKDTNLYDAEKYSKYEAFADDLTALVDGMNFGPSVFVGHSMSGLIGCLASIKRPELFKKLILIGASPRYINSEDYEGGFNTSDVEQIFSSIESNYYQWASNFVSIAVDAKDPESVEKFKKCFKSMRPEVALSLAKTIFLSDYRDTLEEVVTPCTIIQTTNDIVAPKSVVEYMQKRIKGESMVECIDAVGHFPQLTAHIQLLEVLGKVLGFQISV
ncbi:unnamed protein product [Ilex paraguariensis]|uniref:AB hydrolase-1 domain-containing protein n=1 Tax=Ilex paraguariensis TaxID=185542 RepID=A0ABC8SC32_9AQUA